MTLNVLFLGEGINERLNSPVYAEHNIKVGISAVLAVL